MHQLVAFNSLELVRLSYHHFLELKQNLNGQVNAHSSLIQFKVLKSAIKHKISLLLLSTTFRKFSDQKSTNISKPSFKRAKEASFRTEVYIC